MKELTPLEEKVWTICLKSLEDIKSIPSNGQIAHKLGIKNTQQINELLRNIETKKGGHFILRRVWKLDK